MIEINMSIHDIIIEYDGIILVGANKEVCKVNLNAQEWELLRERLGEKNIRRSRGKWDFYMQQQLGLVSL